MAEIPSVKPHDEIRIAIRRAVVCTIHEPGRVEVVYLDDKHQAINENAVWRGEKWEFEYSGPSGGYADKYDHLQSFVAQLRRPRPQS